MNRCLASIVAPLALCMGCLALPPTLKAEAPADFPYLVEPVSQKWLSDSSVIALTQTRDGYLWLGTLNGLGRYDGVHCTVFTEANMPALKGSPIVYLFQDSHTNLWVGTESAGIVQINSQGAVRSLDFGAGSRAGRLVSATEDNHGAVWLNTADGRVARFQNHELEILNGRARPFVAEKSGLLWAGTGRELIAMRAISNSFAFFFEQESPIHKLDYLLPDRTNGCWRLADGRVQKWTNGRLERDWGPYPWGNSQVNTACEDNHGNLIVGTQDKGVFWYNSNGKATQIWDRNGLSHDTVLSLCVDREGDLWVGTDSGGLNRVRRKLINVQEGSMGLTTQSVCRDRKGGVWFAIFGGKLSHWKDGVLKQYSVTDNPQDPYVRSVFMDRDNNLWVGTVLEGVFLRQGDSFHQIPGSWGRGPVSAIFEDHQGRLWFGAQGGLVCRDGTNTSVFTTQEGLSANDIRALAENSNGTLWIGTEGGGLNYLKDGKFAALHKRDGLPSESITSLFIDREGSLWIGTGAGLARLREDKSGRYTVQKVLPGRSIGYVTEDEQGDLWVGSDVGLIRISKQALNGLGTTPAGAVPYRLYGKEDGMPTQRCTEGSQPAACRTQDGRLWLCTIRGLVSLNPARLKPNPFKPPVVIESVRIDGVEQDTNTLSSGSLRAVVVPAHREHLEIQYTSLNLGSPDRAQFRYRLEGLETAWTDAEGSRVARFSQLPPGHYRFQVIACNEDGVWNQAGASLAITVLPPFWRTWWFIGLNSALLLAALVFSVRYASTQKLQRQLAVLRQQEALEKERARIARDLHDQLGANLTQVALLGDMSAEDKQLPDEVEIHARQISQTARETTRALDEIVWAVNPSNDTLEGLITYACKYAQEYFAVAGLRHRLDVPTQLPQINVAPEFRHNVFLAFKEAVNNVVKHAQASEARIRLTLQDGSFSIEIQDNGVGPADVGVKQGRNGLQNMRKRMDDVAGNFSIEPAPGGGTLVRLTVPLAKP